MIQVQNVTHFFGPFKALDGVSFSIEQGAIHALIGENGAGKSTLAKIVAGVMRPSEGSVTFTDEKIGDVGMIYQHFSLVDRLTVLENWILFTKTRPFRALFKFEEMQRKFGMSFDPLQRVEDMHLADKQKLEIFNQLCQDKKIIILDEPTAVLSPYEIKKLLSQLKQFRSQGKTLILITHKLKEVLSVCDSATVLQKGRHVWTGPCRNMQIAELARMMVGRDVSFERRSLNRVPVLGSSQPLLEFKEIFLHRSGRSCLENFSLQVYPGEIVGIVGVEGNGQECLIEFLCEANGATKLASGEWSFAGQNLPKYKSLRSLGWGVLPEDRNRDGFLTSGTLLENFFLGQRFPSLLSRVPWRKGIGSLKALAAKYSIRHPGLTALGKALSGGNQQKLVIARELHHKPAMILALHPSRGVDIGSQEFIHDELLKSVEAGAGLLVISSELDEVLKLADRIVVLYKGRIQGELARSEFDERTIGQWMVGGDSEKAYI